MARILIFSASEASRTQLARLLASSGYAVYRLCASESDLRRTLAQCEDGIVLFAGSMAHALPDEIAADFGDRFQVLVIGRAEALSVFESPQVFKLAYPCPGNAVLGAVEMLSQLHSMRLPRRQGRERNLVEEAKRVLMLRYQIDEPEAHRRLQRYAMRHGMKMADCAALVLQNSEETEE